MPRSVEYLSKHSPPISHTLSASPTGTLRERRQQTSRELELARATANQAGTAQTLMEERNRNSESALNAAVVARDAALAAFPEGVEVRLAGAQAALTAAVGEREQVAVELASLEGMIAAQNVRVEAAIRDARATAEEARARLGATQVERTKAITDHASQVGRIEETTKTARRLKICSQLRIGFGKRRIGMPPCPSLSELSPRPSSPGGADDMTTAMSDLATIERDIHRTHGALEQVAGAVARDRLRDATEAFEAAERSERETEADYEAWCCCLNR